MPEKSEARILADVFQEVRNLTKWYISKTDSIPLHERIVANGVQLNSLYWLMGHIAWAEHGLLITSLGGEKMDIPWLGEFRLGQEFEYNESMPTKEEILTALDKIHDRAMRTVIGLTPEQLDEPSGVAGFFGPDSPRRNLIRHAIRHEPCHAGHIGWLLKMHGVATV